MNVLIACEESGIVRDAFRKRGHNAVSCDLLPSRRPGPHLQCDVFEIIDAGWDLMLAFPPCTYLSSSGLHRNKNPKSPRYGGRQTEEALLFVQRLFAAKIKRKGYENPIGCISTRIRKPDQIIQPNQFGEDASKATCFWLENLPLLLPTKHVPGRLVEWKGKIVERWSNQTDSGQNRLAPSINRAQIRSETYPGIADAMAEQWGCL